MELHDAAAAGWAGIVPEADRGGLAETGSTYLEKRDSKHCHVVVFKIKREFDVTVLKWEESQDGTVAPGRVGSHSHPARRSLRRQADRTTDASGAAV